MTNLISSLSNAEALRVTAELNRSEKETLRQQAETTRAGFYDGFNTELGKKSRKSWKELSDQNFTRRKRKQNLKYLTILMRH